MNNLVAAKNWQARRQVPGRGVNDPVAARTALAYIAGRAGSPINPSDGIRIVDNEITKRGIQASTARDGEVVDDRIHDIDCGTGPAVWLQTLSDGWRVSGNHITDVASSGFKRYMQEGIRIGMASNYNVVEGNIVEKLTQDGRAFTTDVDSSFNTFRLNTARDVAMGFNEQKGGWGNVGSATPPSGHAPTASPSGSATGR